MSKPASLATTAKVQNDMTKIIIQQICNFVKRNNLPSVDKSVDDLFATALLSYLKDDQLFAQETYTGQELARVMQVASLETRLGVTLYVIDKLKDTAEYKKLLKDGLD